MAQGLLKKGCFEAGPMYARRRRSLGMSRALFPDVFWQAKDFARRPQESGNRQGGRREQHNKY